MALIKCAECGREVSDLAAACPGCGAPIPRVSASARSPTPGTRPTLKAEWIILLVLLPVAAVLILVAVLRSPSAEADGRLDSRSELRKDKTAIEYCEQRYTKMNLDRKYDREALIFHADACRKMRSDFLLKWGREP